MSKIRDMRRNGAVVLAMLVYFLTLPAVPGAFMFESAESSENARVAHRRARVLEAVPQLPLAGDSLDRSQPDLTRGRANVRAQPSFRRHGVTKSLARASVDSAAPSEDPLLDFPSPSAS